MLASFQSELCEFKFYFQIFTSLQICFKCRVKVVHTSTYTLSLRVVFPQLLSTVRVGLSRGSTSTTLSRDKRLNTLLGLGFNPHLSPTPQTSTPSRSHRMPNSSCRLMRSGEQTPSCTDSRCGSGGPSVRPTVPHAAAHVWRTSRTPTARSMPSHFGQGCADS